MQQRWEDREDVFIIDDEKFSAIIGVNHYR